MSNEELVVLIQSGERDKLSELWAQIRGMALKEARGWAVHRSGGAELEDLEQAGFIALMRAVGSFDPSAGGKFSTLYYPIMRGEFQRAVGRRTAKQAQDPLHTAGSLDLQVGEDEDSATVGELVPDPAAAQAFEDVEEQDRLTHLHMALGPVLASLPEQQRDTLRRHYYQRQTIEEIAAVEGVNRSTVYSWHNKALRALRHPRVSRELRRFL